MSELSMRKEPYSVGSYVHIVKRGARGMNIVRDDSDRWRFLRLLRYLNDENVPQHWDRDITPSHIRAGFQRPESWAVQKPYTSIIAFCLMDNHFHLLVQETREGGISKFMQRICTSMSMYFNTKYDERGTIFQGAFRSRTVDTDDYLQYLAAYIQVKNPFERYPGGFRAAAESFDAAFEWALNDPFSSLGDFAGSRNSPLLDHSLMNDVLEERAHFKQFARDVVGGKLERDLSNERQILS
ncbi:hypothetical protein FJY94_07460 [Candidatus Kaiserbacteria bacterium]|nr:hypothetical protein [Candidatus Kaiserbacteria bacterium]